MAAMAQQSMVQLCRQSTPAVMDVTDLRYSALLDVCAPGAAWPNSLSLSDAISCTFSCRL